MRTSNKSDKDLIRLFSVYIVLMPILQYYKSPLSAFNAGTFICMAFLIAFLIKLCRKNAIKLRVAPVTIAYIILLLTNYCLQVIYRDAPYINGLTMNYLRAFMLVITILLVGCQYFDEQFAFNTLGILLTISAFIMMIQIASGFLGIHFTGTIPFLLTEPGYGVPTSRVSGLYMEPSHYAQSALLYICWSLFSNNQKTRRQIIEMSIVMIGIVLSTSGQGYILLAVVLFIWYWQNFAFTRRINKHNFFNGILLLAIIGVVLAIAANSALFKFAIDHLSSDQGILGSQGFLGRTWSEYLLDQISARDKWIGMGLGSLKNVYMTGYNLYLYSFGYSSYLFFVILIGQIFFSKKSYSLPFSIIFAIEIYISSVISPYYICFFMSFVLGKNRIEYMERGELVGAE